MLFLLDAVGHAFVLNLYLSVFSKESDADCPAFVPSFVPYPNVTGKLLQIGDLHYFQARILGFFGKFLQRPFGGCRKREKCIIVLHKCKEVLCTRQS